MNATAKLQELGQSLWLDNITREMLDSGQLQRYIEEFSITGLTSNPSIFDKAIKSGAYEDEIRHTAVKAADRETLFLELAIEDLRRTREPVHQDPGDRARPAGDRRGDVRRGAGKRHAPVLARAVPGQRGCVHARDRAPARSRSGSECFLGRIGVHLPVGRGGYRSCSRAAARPARAG